MIDIVIPLGTGSKWDDNELRYSLRSFEKYLSGFGDVFIVGECPGWITGVVHIPCPDIRMIGASNATNKILTACLDRRLSNNFLLSNDDFFLLKPVEAIRFPYYCRNDLMFRIEKLGNTTYARSRKKTFEYLTKNGYGTRSFEVHCPMVMNKFNFCDTMNRVDWENGHLCRSIYGNVMNIPATKRGDYIVNLPLNLSSPIEQNQFFSIRDEMVNSYMIQLFEELYPNPSKFEK